MEEKEEDDEKDETDEDEEDGFNEHTMSTELSTERSPNIDSNCYVIYDLLFHHDLS